MSDDTAFLQTIHSLLTAPADGAESPSLDAIEDVLTAGYARALALEAERWRLERRIGELAAQLGEGEGQRTGELGRLARALSEADGDLVRLRSALGSLRDRASAVRAVA